MVMRRVLGVGAVALLAVVAAGCGGSKSPSVASLGPSTTSTTPSSSSGDAGGKPSTTDMIKFVHCMQSHGVDAQLGEGGRGVSISARPGSNAQLQRAQKACQKLLPGGGPKAMTPAQQAADLKRLVKLSKCMRAHGIKNFPDPTGSGGIQLNASSGLDPRSPQFQAAAKACGGPGAKGGGFRINVQGSGP
jgi:hypothetical protein